VVHAGHLVRLPKWKVSILFNLAIYLSFQSSSVLIAIVNHLAVMVDGKITACTTYKTITESVLKLTTLTKHSQICALQTIMVL
jgi:hypothetical protein